MNNIILIGMPAVGKSTIGVILAKILGYDFIDSDLMIQKQEDCLLKEIIKEKGIEGFWKIEEDVNRQIQGNHLIIATGGSAVYGKKAMEHFKEIGTIIYLKEEYEILKSRLSNVKGRGVTLRDGQTLRELYDERSILYESYADITVNENARGVEETIQEIISLIGSLA
ncbi:MAG: shikimate kinase [Lachnospiraceae bacterium]|nr:shikimate kinase [Lachnospiraceae bacterium]